jgi:hypothetical protein
MNPFEDLIRELGAILGTSLLVDQHQSCCLHFPLEEISAQIDLSANADQVLIGAQLGTVHAGSYREKIFLRAMSMNGMANIMRGTLAYSEKNNSLVLFYFLPLAFLNGERLFTFLQRFISYGKIWKNALGRGDIPLFEEEIVPTKDRMFGL